MNRTTARPTKVWSNFKATVSRAWNCLIHCNPSAVICSHLIGKNHSHGHRLMVGLIIMVVGVVIAKTGGGLTDQLLPHSISHYTHYFFDLIGYLGHGVGAMPYLESLERFRTGD